MAKKIEVETKYNDILVFISMKEIAINSLRTHTIDNNLKNQCISSIQKTFNLAYIF